VGLERGPLSRVSTIEELLERKISGFGLESRDYGRRDPPRRPRNTPLSAKVLTSPTIGGRSVGIVRSRTKGTELLFIIIIVIIIIIIIILDCIPFCPAPPNPRGNPLGLCSEPREQGFL
jgi:hypothetical protein